MSLLPHAAGGRRAQATTRKSGNLPTELADSTSRIRGMRKVRRCPGFGRAIRTDFSPVHSPVSRVFLCARPPAPGAGRDAPEKECY